MNAPDSAPMFVNGQAMSGGSLNDALRGARFLGPVQTAPRYRFFTVRDEFPAMLPVDAGGASIEGELYEVSLADLRERLLPREPRELELAVIELADGRGAFAMRLRSEFVDAFPEITHWRSWRTYLSQRSQP